MTCREKYVKDHPGGMLLRITRSGCIPSECPADYGYLEDPSYCDPDTKLDGVISLNKKYTPEVCRMCWDREIPETENKEKENENMPMKTKTELYKELEAKEQDIKNLHAEIEKLEKYRVYEETADEMARMHRAFMNTGFTNDQAFQLIRDMFGSALSALHF